MKRKSAPQSVSATPPTPAVVPDSLESAPSTATNPAGQDPTPPEPNPSPAGGTSPQSDITRVGKIARLPKAIRDEVNHRLLDGERAAPILEWLNAQPEVQAVLARWFAGRPINEQNLSQWRLGGFRHWVAHQFTSHQMLSLAEIAHDLAPRTGRNITDQLAVQFISGCLLNLPDLTHADAHSPDELKRLQQVAELLNHLRRGDHQASKLSLERERLALAKRREHYRTCIEKRKPLREVTLADYRAVFGIPDPEEDEHQAPKPGNTPDSKAPGQIDSDPPADENES